MRKLWEDSAWEEYLEWQTKDKKVLKKTMYYPPLFMRVCKGANCSSPVSRFFLFESEGLKAFGFFVFTLPIFRIFPPFLFSVFMIEYEIIKLMIVWR